MRLRHITMSVFAFFLTLGVAHAASKEEVRVMDSTDIVDQLLRIPEQGIPARLLSRASAIAVVPEVLKIGFGIGGRHGRGILVVRQDDGSWSNPAFVRLTGGSFGFQAGAQSTDIILVFKNRSSVDGITSGKLTLGADASVAAGPVGRAASAATDWKFSSEVFSYSRNRGLFAGVALEGAGLTMDRKANAAYYGNPGITPEQIFASSGNAAPPSANNFVQVLTAHTEGLPKRPATGVAAQTTPGSRKIYPQEETRSEVRTYGMNSGTEDDLD
jgi:lipid-binding SYLF domain-containing protein